jgi:serine/threonine protein kinase
MSWIDSKLPETYLPEYRVRRRIATGGQRSVFLAEHHGKPVAIKVMRPETFDEDRFQAEADLLRSIDSEFVEALHDVGRLRKAIRQSTSPCGRRNLTDFGERYMLASSIG